MQTYQPSLFARNDTLLGVCEAIGEDLGFNPNYLRVALAVGVFFSLAASVGVYLAMGAVVLATRLLHRAPRKLASQPVAAPVEAEAAPAITLVAARNDAELVPMAAAA
jgi:phage shock protein PspC (stress-responsive transcriptional regulator)